MTISQYLNDALRPYGVTEGELTDIYLNAAFSPDDEYTAENSRAVGISLTEALPQLILRPRMSNVSENGFSVSWNYENLSKYYLWLCKRYGVTPDETISSMTGLSVIRDRSGMW